MTRIVVTLLAALILTPAASSRPTEAACVADLRAPALAASAEARRSHENWITAIAAGRVTPEQIKIAGDIAWHQRWVDHYATITAALNGARFAC